MTYERDRVNRTCLPDEVCIKKSMLTTLLVGLVALLVVIGVLVWQHAQDQQQLNNCLYNSSAKTVPASSQRSLQTTQ